MIDTKIIPFISPATGRHRLRLVVINEAGEHTFMVFWPYEECIARDYANMIKSGANTDKLRMTCSEDRFLAEPVMRVGRQGRPRKERA